ncbi:MAG TPA: type II secretion system protein [Thermoanaerobaculia bacterium]|nr:type II secretion system protein [Thermoanaerobaculia bacterium]
MILTRLPSRAGRPAGFTLLEALIALTILGIALLMGMALVIQLPRDVRRLDAERQAMRAMEATLEAMRAGVLPVQDSELSEFITLAGAPAARDLGITVTVAPTSRPGLYQVTLTAHYSVLNTKHKKQLQALFRSTG